MVKNSVVKEFEKKLKQIDKNLELRYIGECSLLEDSIKLPENYKDKTNMYGVFLFLYDNISVRFGKVVGNTKYKLDKQLKLIDGQIKISRHGEHQLPILDALKKGKKVLLYIIPVDNQEYAKQIKNKIEETFEPYTSSDYDITALLEFKKQIILQGAPGTGKTYTAKKIAEAMGCGYEVIQFHPSYTYEDFVRGIVSKTDENGNIRYEVEDKILMNAIKKAEENKNKNKPYILIIDEINRANLPSVLGELLYALEYRDEAVICPYKKDKEDEGKIIIPKNLYIIGTMNTADRSIGSIDYAVRRRFAFYTVIADEKFIKDDYSKKAFNYVKNEIIEKHLSEEYQLDDIMIGHSYFIFNDEEAYSDTDLARKYMNLSLQYNIIPLLEEYYKDGILIDKDEEVMKKLDYDKLIEAIDKYSEAEQ